MHHVSGSTGAAPIWANIMAFLHTQEPSHAPLPPQGLVRAAVVFGPTPAAQTTPQFLEAARQEWFLPGTQQAVFSMDLGATTTTTTTRITAPAQGTIIALDPDIPPTRQRLQLRAVGDVPQLRWRLDGKPLGQGGALAWLPWPGRHTLQLTNMQGTVLDEVRFEVRGAGLKNGTSIKHP